LIEPTPPLIESIIEIIFVNLILLILVAETVSKKYIIYYKNKIFFD